jgi:hypothetical protein
MTTRVERYVSTGCSSIRTPWRVLAYSARVVRMFSEESPKIGTADLLGRFSDDSPNSATRLVAASVVRMRLVSSFSLSLSFLTTSRSWPTVSSRVSSFPTPLMVKRSARVLQSRNTQMHT